MEPTMVPASALDTVTPSASGERWKRSVSAWVVPEITTVSKPNSSPPSAATTVLRRRTEFNGIVRTFQQSCAPSLLQSTDMERLCQRGILVDSLVRRENYFLGELFGGERSPRWKHSTGWGIVFIGSFRGSGKLAAFQLEFPRREICQTKCARK